VFHTQIHISFAVALDILQEEGERQANEMRYKVRKGLQDTIERGD